MTDLEKLQDLLYDMAVSHRILTEQSHGHTVLVIDDEKTPCIEFYFTDGRLWLYRKSDE